MTLDPIMRQVKRKTPNSDSNSNKHPKKKTKTVTKELAAKKGFVTRGGR